MVLLFSPVVVTIMIIHDMANFFLFAPYVSISF